ncbi:serine--tRNA ligase [Patescibacteria group bacterium]|nr:serine--tRNA ligase [Patescibacteria group bacterium]
MIDLKLIKENPNLIKKACDDRGVKFDFTRTAKLIKEKSTILQKVEIARSEKNQASKQIPKLKGDDRNKLIAQMKKVDHDANKLEKRLKDIDQQLGELLLQLPNIPKDDVKVGDSEADNEVIKEVGQPKKFAFKPQDYLTLTKKLDLIDIKRAAKVAGSRFGYIKGDLALLGNALFQYGKDQLSQNGFDLIFPPLLIKDEIMRGLGYIEGIEEKDKYHFGDDGLYLVATGEHAMIPLHADEFLDNEKLPQTYFTYSPCFRREAGSYGKDTKGIFRVHQFDKMEMVAFTKAEESDEVHQFMLGIAEKLIKDLGLPYRVTKMVTGDLAFPSARSFDIECHFPVQNKYRETGSISTCTDFQARRLNIRYKDGGETKYVHTLNGTAYAMGRTLIAIVENYQTKEGQIEVPEVLQQYCNLKIIK